MSRCVSLRQCDFLESVLDLKVLLLVLTSKRQYNFLESVLDLKVPVLFQNIDN